MHFYRKHWQDVGGLVALVIGGGLAVVGQWLSRPQLWSALNVVALLVHQFEEYRFPGFFPGHYNRGLCNSATPDRYPLNTNAALLINTAFGYPFYLLPVLLPKHVWLGLAPVVFGFGQVVAHGLVFPRMANVRYSPGIVAALCLHLPIGIAYLRCLQREQPIHRWAWIKASIYVVIAFVAGVRGPLHVCKDPASPYRFTQQQVGPYGGDHT